MLAFVLSASTVDGNVDSGTSLVSALLGASGGLTVTGTSYIGAAIQAGTYIGFKLISTDPGGTRLTLWEGIIMTTGNAALPLPNASPSFTSATGTGSIAQADAELAGTPGFDGTRDQNVLSVTF